MRQNKPISSEEQEVIAAGDLWRSEGRDRTGAYRERRGDVRRNADAGDVERVRFHFLVVEDVIIGTHSC